MGITDNGAKVAVSAIDGLKSNPMVLGLIIINLFFLVGTGWILLRVADTVHTGNERRDKMLTEIIKDCRSCESNK